MRIIVADDMEGNRLLISEILKGMGHELIEVENGQQVIDAVDKYHDINLILMDIEMPVMSGIEAARIIRSERGINSAYIPIIGITGYYPDSLPKGLSESVFDEILSKPYSIEKISGLILTYSKSSNCE